MSQQGAALQTYNNELVKCIEELCVRRDNLQKEIIEEEEEKMRLQNDLGMLTDRLSKVNESLCKKMTSRNEFDRTIVETEAAYTRILESSQTLLSVLKKDSTTLGATTSTSASTARYPPTTTSTSASTARYPPTLNSSNTSRPPPAQNTGQRYPPNAF